MRNFYSFIKNKELGENVQWREAISTVTRAAIEIITGTAFAHIAGLSGAILGSYLEEPELCQVILLDMPEVDSWALIVTAITVVSVSKRHAPKIQIVMKCWIG